MLCWQYPSTEVIAHLMKALCHIGLGALGLLTSSVLLAASAATAQPSSAQPNPQRFVPYATAAGDTTYGLSEREAQALLAGRGMGMARPAEMNGYPGPMHVLELADELALTPEQKQEAQEARERVLIDAPALGRQVVEKELALDRLFRSGSADEARIDELTQDIARLRAELRAIHLKAHLVMHRALAVEQVRTYMDARGHTASRLDSQ